MWRHCGSKPFCAMRSPSRNHTHMYPYPCKQVLFIFIKKIVKINVVKLRTGIKEIRTTIELCKEPRTIELGNV